MRNVLIAATTVLAFGTIAALAEDQKCPDGTDAVTCDNADTPSNDTAESPSGTGADNPLNESEAGQAVTDTINNAGDN